MRPLSVLTAMIFGSSVAIGFGLSATLTVFLILRSEAAQVERELGSLAISCGFFLLMSVVSGLSLYSNLKRLGWRMPAQIGMWACLLGVGLYYWPK